MLPPPPKEPAFRTRTHCSLCGSGDLEELLRLTPTPPANAFESKPDIHAPCFPLVVQGCQQCEAVQLRDVVNPKMLFSNYLYRSGTSPSFVRHFEAYAEALTDRYQLGAGSFVVEIGSNDGTLLKQFRPGILTFGVEPAENLAQIAANENGVGTLTAFFDAEVAEYLRVERGAADLIVANNVFAHIDGLGKTLDAIRILLKPTGAFVFEVQYLGALLRDGLFDMIYHEHLNYHAVKPLRRLLADHGFVLQHVEAVPTHGGSIRCHAHLRPDDPRYDPSVATFEAREIGFVSHLTWRRLEDRIRTARTHVQKICGQAIDTGGVVIGYGAPAKATTFLYEFDLADTLEFVVDDSPLKQDHYLPGTKVRIVPRGHLEAEAGKRYSLNRMPPTVLVLAWNFAEQIITANRELMDRGARFVVPFPEVTSYP